MTTPAPHDRTEQRRRIGPRAAAALVLAPVAVAAMVSPVFAAPVRTGEPVPGGTTTTTTPVVPATTTTSVPTAPTTTTTVGPTHQPPDTIAPTTTVAPAPVAPPHAALNIRVGPESLGHILATIRYLESRGNYLAPPNKGNASGAYQFIARTWNNYGGYPHAYLAPPEVQDERATLDVMTFLQRWNNDVSMIPVMWYLPAAATNPWRLDVVPLPEAGNVLTVREYQTRWLGIFSFISQQPLPFAQPQLSEAERAARAGLPPVLPVHEDGSPSIAYPVLGPSRVAAPECDTTVQPAEGPDPTLFIAAGLCSEQAPGIVFGVQLQPVVAIADGVITDVHDDPGTDEPITVVVTDATGRSYVHAGFNDDNPGTDDGAAPPHLRLSGLVQVGYTVHAGQVLGFMGNSDPLPLGVRADVPTDATVSIDPDAVAPHIRISIVELDGTQVDAFGPLIDALFRQTCTVATGPWSMTENGSGHAPITIETTDNAREIDSQWTIDSTGRVTSTGWAAMINPNDGCLYAPVEPHGPGAAGSPGVPWSWLAPIDLPTAVWVQLADRGADRTTPALLRRG